ncbi:AraC family transcriptional regulator [Clostridium sp. A1-XYC3]|uniref:AraC family transcriptional regulator n=2 Tax=Clostridium TaxID=1485 RepID=A0ABU4JWS4_9CLOT|nr:AraC family transcriptional regulator [Clostridium sp. A1-XYC3]MDW8802364.1 AraC family transcriptional regulator [Clostridium sp. A1-XYC3]
MNTTGKFQFLNQVSKVVQQSKDGFHTLYKLDCLDGQGDMTVYQVFPGIELFLANFDSTSCTFQHKPYGNTMQINYCQEGRVGWQLESGACMYLGEGDLSIHMMDNCVSSTMSFPVKLYRGIGVVVDLDKVADYPPEILCNTAININEFKRKFCEDDHYLVMPARDEIEHIFSKLYSLPNCVQRPYFKLKVQELLLFLWMIDVNKEKQREQYLSPQVEIIKRVHKQLISNLRERPTIEELSKEYLINTATLKSTFKGVYGQPIATYMKEYRIHQAANLLRRGNDMIADIAKQVGYENQGKFATAFKKIMKVSPTEYRLQHQIESYDVINCL